MISRRRGAVVLAGVVVEAGALLVAGAWIIWQVAAGHAASPATALGLAVFAFALAALIALVGRALVRTGSGIARGVLVTWQLVQAGSAGTIIGANAAAPGVLAAAWGAAVLSLAVVVAAVIDAWQAQSAAQRPEDGQSASRSDS